MALRWLAIAGIWAVAAALTAAQIVAAAAVVGREQAWSQALSYSAAGYAIWALLTPALLEVGRRTPLDPRRRIKLIAAHLALGSAVATLHAFLYAALFGFLHEGDPRLHSLAALWAHKLTSTFHINLAIYLIVVGLVIGARAQRSLRDRQLESANLEARLAEAEAATLRAQMQPHFLFNSLHTISALVRPHPILAERLIARLGELLRMSLQRREPLSSFEEELAFCDAYLAIEKRRFGRRLRVERDIAPEALPVQVPTLVLQPLVENAVRHGLAPTASGGTIRIEAMRTGASLRFCVSDDGRGADRVAPRTGLANTRERLHRLFGERYAMRIDTAPGQGFRVEITVPA